MNSFITRPVILASQSPRRKQLLEWACVDFEVQVSEADESFKIGTSPEAVALQIAKRKADAVWCHSDKKRVVVAADTIVVCEDEIIGKPVDRDDAIRILQKLSGNVHQVITGVCMNSVKKDIEFFDVTEVRFHPLTESQICFYVDGFKPYDKAGAYAIQEWIGVVGIHSIRGDFYNVMGLPVSRVMEALRQLDQVILPKT